MFAKKTTDGGVKTITYFNTNNNNHLLYENFKPVSLKFSSKPKRIRRLT